MSILGAPFSVSAQQPSAGAPETRPSATEKPPVRSDRGKESPRKGDSGYWTEERKRNAKPAMPLVRSGRGKEAPPKGDSGYWTEERKRNAKPAMPLVPSDAPVR